MRGATLSELAAEAGLQAPDPRAFTTLAEFQEVFQAAFAATQTRLENLLRLVREVVADAAADGVVWVQPHFDPHLYPRFGAPQQVMELVLAEELARFAAAYAGQCVYALGLTGDILVARCPAALRRGRGT